MRARTACWVAVLGFLLSLYASAPKPAGWVPARWPWSDAASLDLLAGGPINCLLLKEYTREFAEAAANRGLATLAMLTPGPDVAAAARRALAANVTGIALEGDFPEGVVAEVKDAAGGAAVVEITSRGRMLADANAPLLATYQGVWPGVSVEENGARRAGPSGSAWIDTNTGFIRAVRAWSDAPLWLANQPPAKTVVAASRYLEAIADAEASGARWVWRWTEISPRGWAGANRAPWKPGGGCSRCWVISKGIRSGAPCANTASSPWCRTPPKGAWFRAGFSICWL